MAFRGMAFAKRLVEGGIEPQMAQTFAGAMEEFVVSELVTKDYFQEHLDSRLAQLEARFDAKLETKFAGMRTEMNSRFAEIQTEMNSKFSEIRTEMNRRFAETEGKFAALDAKIDTKIDSLRAGMTTALAALQVQLIRWMVASTAGATLAIILTLLRVVKP